MFPRGASVAARYTFTIVVVILATFVRFGLAPAIGEGVPFILYYPAVVLCAWFGGLWPGLLSTTLGALIAWYAFIPPPYSFQLAQPNAPTQLIVFLLGGTLISLLAESLHRMRKKTEQSELKEREERERFRVTLGSIGDAVIAADAQGRVTFVNPIAESLTGWRDEEAAGRPLPEIFHVVDEQTRGAVDSPALRAMQEGVIVSLSDHAVLIGRDGTERPIDAGGAPIRDAGGTTLGSVLTFRDVTERERTERARSLLAEQATLLDSGFDAIIVRDAQDRITRWNRAAAELYGWTSEEALGQVTHSLFNTVFPQPLDEITAGLHRDHRWQGELIHTRKDGQLVTVLSCWVLKRDAQGRPVSVLETNMNITERKRAEEALRDSEALLSSVLQQLPVGLGVMDTNGRWTISNAVMDRWAPRGIPSAVPDRTARWRAYDPDGQAVPPENWPGRRALRGETVSPGLPMIFTGEDGRDCWMRVSAAPFRDEAGRIVGATCVVQDIDQIKRAQDKLAEQAGILDIVDDAIYAVDEEIRFTEWNEAAERMFGYKAGEVLGLKAHEVLGAKISPEERAAHVQRLLAGEVLRLENEQRRKDGSPIWVDVTALAQQNSVRGRTRFVTISRDITERKRAEEALRARESELEIIVNRTSFMLTRCSRDLRYRYVSRAYAEMIGRRQEEVAGRPIVDIVGEEAFRTILPHVESVLAGNRVEYESEVAFEGVGQRFLHVVYTPDMDERGEVQGWIASILDMTERKRAEQALADRLHEIETIMEVLPVGLFVAQDRGSTRIVGNRVAREFSGIHDGREANLSLTAAPGEAPMPFRVLKDGREVPPEELPVQRAAAEGVAIHGLELDLVFSDGTVKHELLSALPLFDQNGIPRGAVASSMDITERKRAEEERSRLLASERAAREQAEAASRAKDEFVAVISHELRSPLTAILGWAQLLRRGDCEQPMMANAIEVIERSARAQAQIVDDLLDISRVITGKLALHVRPVDLTQVIKAAIDTIRPAADARGIHLDVQLESKATLVSGDPNRLQQVVWNLLSNAVKFTPHNGRVEVRTERVDSHVQLTVSDSGVGMTPEFLPVVFDRFSQASTGSERRYSGLGLGLAIVRHLVELHGGAVRADSAGEGRGATFTVTLPVKPAREELGELDPADHAVAHGAALTAMVTLNGVRVMVVDDEAETRDVLTAMLTGRGAEVRACATAAEALEALEQWRPLVLVSDIAMPDEDGYALIHRLRALGSERGGSIPAVALTALARTEDRLRALATGFQMHIPKPVEADQLITVIATLAGRASRGAVR